MEPDLNGQDKRVIAQYISDTLSKYEMFQKDKHQHTKHYEARISAQENELTQQKQRNQLLEEELREMKQRYSYLKRQQDILGMARQQSKHDNDSFLRFKINDISSIVEIDQEKLKDMEFQKAKLKKRLQQVEAYCQRLKEQNQQCQKQIAILTDYINQKEIKNNEAIQRLERQKEEIDTGRNAKQLKEGNEMIKTLQKQKKQLENKIQKCSNVVKELEDFYTKQIQSLKAQMKESERKKKQTVSEDSQRQIHAIQESLKAALKSKTEADKANASLSIQLEGLTRKFEEDMLEIINKREQQKQQSQFYKNLLIDTYEKKIEINQDEFTRKAQEYEDKIQFLIIKLEQSHHPISQIKKSIPSRLKLQPGMNLQEMSMCQSLMVSHRVQDSARWEPTSVSRSIKQNLSRPAKRVELQAHKQTYLATPVKGVGSHGVLSERVNLL